MCGARTLYDPPDGAKQTASRSAAAQQDQRGAVAALTRRRRDERHHAAAFRPRAAQPVPHGRPQYGAPRIGSVTTAVDDEHDARATRPPRGEECFQIADSSRANASMQIDAAVDVAFTGAKRPHLPGRDVGRAPDDRIPGAFDDERRRCRFGGATCGSSCRGRSPRCRHAPTPGRQRPCAAHGLPEGAVVVVARRHAPWILTPWRRVVRACGTFRPAGS
jgi:hypothetical protein